jgi:small subunit ribosomal protein S1
VRGKVTRVTDFGAFVELGPGVEGLAHISELGGGQGGGGAGGSRTARQGKDALKAGEPLDVTVIGVDLERRRLSLSLAAPDEALDPEARAAVDRSAAPRAGKLGTFGDLFKNVSPPAKR